jgi:hypothetical protein
VYTCPPANWLIWNALSLSCDAILAVGGVQDGAVRKESGLRNVSYPGAVVFLKNFKSYFYTEDKNKIIMKF